MELTQFNSFKELISTPVNESEHKEILRMKDEIYYTSYSNEIWIGVILDFLNNNNEDKYYSEYYLNPEGSYKTRKCMYHIISTQEDIPSSITDEEVLILKKFNAQPQFILYDFEDKTSTTPFDHLYQNRTLKKVLESIGMTKELKEHLCEFCFNRVKKEQIKKQQEEIIEQQKRVLSKENIELLFKNHDFKYILEAVWKCNQNLNVELLNFISINAQKLMSNPNANIFNKEQLKELIKKTHKIPGHMSTMNYEELVEWYNDDIVKYCEQILTDIVLISCDNYEYFGHILEQLYKNENANVRLYCCANGDYTRFLNDPSQRVVKVANIRDNFDKKWNSLSDNEKERINFLVSASKNGKIGYFNYDVLIIDADDKSRISFQSGLFKETKSSRIFDNDILCTIGDERILADTINELIKQGELILNYDIVPDCFKNKKEIQQEKNNSVFAKKLIPSKHTGNK